MGTEPSSQPNQKSEQLAKKTALHAAPWVGSRRRLCPECPPGLLLLGKAQQWPQCKVAGAKWACRVEPLSVSAALLAQGLGL